MLLSPLAWGQTIIPGTTISTAETIISDTVNNSSYEEFEKQVGLQPIELSGSVFEVRLYKLVVVRNQASLRLIRLVNGQWEALQFEQKSKSRISRFTLSPKVEFETLVKKLIEQKVVSLPDQDKVDKRIEDSYPSKKDALAARPGIMDGYAFTVEIKIDSAFRVYQFRNPEVYAKSYKNVEEFRDYASIIRTFEEDLMRK